MARCGSVLLVPDGPGNPDIECRCERLKHDTSVSAWHFGWANRARRRWLDSQARRPVRAL